ncbi:DUF397 domain-containing protein [Thermomonospora sp. CIF 1]|uniref:DUF397 domain-containing protein n=1 Tax=Thermomonospora sp. CIF 1 TaxID=1916083 RepID=UPI000A9DEC74|nr:MAG: DUF397 domain-containing protein [Thermomonospora sp. CIF 1]
MDLLTTWRKSSYSGNTGGGCVEAARIAPTAWRKSTHSGGNGACVEVARMNTATWCKSSHSGGNGDCVEVARLKTVIGLRDSKNPDAGHLTISPGAFATLLTRIKHGELTA